jgi:DNA-binding transcriptional LysR family regulator
MWVMRRERSESSFPSMELRHLRYFVAIAEERSFTRAAERLWIAQPGLSTQIRRLETELGVKLFERHTRGVDLTAAGELFLERARVALAAAEAARSVGEDMEAGLVGSVRLGIATEAGLRRVPSLLAEFAGEHPGIELTVFESYSGTMLRDLRDERLDAVVAPSEFGSADLSSLHLGSESWAVLAGGGHRLAQGAGAVDVRELEGEALVVTGHRDGTGYDRVVAETLGELGATIRPLRAGSGPALFAAVGSGQALALSTAAAAVGGMVARPLEPAGELDFSLMWRTAESPAPALSQLIESVGEPARPVLRAVA